MQTSKIDTMTTDEESVLLEGLKSEMNETTPLVSSPPSASPAKSTEHPCRRRATTVILLAIILVNLSSNILGPAQARIFESAYCLKWYRKHNPELIDHGTVEESYCKIPLVQSQVASLAGWKELFEALPGLFLAIPLGILSDKFGRKWLVLLCFVSILCRTSWTAFVSLFAETLNLKLIWLGSLFNCFSGGDMVAESLVCVILTDVTPRKQLPKTFLYLMASACICGVIGPLICASLMKINNWLPIWVGIVMQVLFAFVAFILPETLQTAEEPNIDLNSRESNETTDNLQGIHGIPKSHKLDQLRTVVLTSLADIRRIFGDWRVVFLAGLYPSRMMSVALQNLQARYVSYRYHWTISNATYLYSVQAAASAIILLLLLPRFSDLIQTRWHLTAIQNAALLAEISLGFSTLGTAVEGIAPTIPILIIGLLLQTVASGGPAAFRALAGSLVPKGDTAKLYMSLAVAETLSMAMFPLTASLYNAGIRRGGGAWLGLPFDVAALFKGVLTIIMCMLTFEK